MGVLAMVAITEQRQMLRCACHGDEVLAELVGDTIVIKSRRHGEQHFLVIHLRPLLTALDTLTKSVNT